MRLRSVGPTGRVFAARRPRASSTTQRILKLVGILAAVLPIEACGGAATTGRDSGRNGATHTDSAVPTNGGDEGGNIADGGISPSESDGATQTAAVTASWDGGPWSPVCPLSNPGEGAACSQPGLQCEYGNAWWNLSCDEVLECRNGVFTSAPFGCTTCEPQPAPNPPSCPPDTGSFKSPCPSAQSGVVCFYGQGSSCTCEQVPVPDGGPDGGPRWECNPSAGCPSTRPRLGEPCNGGLVCPYGAITTITEYCAVLTTSRAWQLMVACPP
jgi:hypothetical protein